MTVAAVGWWAFANAVVKPAYPAAAAVFFLVYGGLSRRRSSRFEAEKRALEVTRKPAARNPYADRLWWSLGSHLLVAAALVLVATVLVATDYSGGDGSYSCNSALEDFMGPRPEESNSEFFDAGPPCWDEAKSRTLTAGVLIPLMITAWAAWCIALTHRRPIGPFVAAFVLVTLIGLYAGYV